MTLQPTPLTLSGFVTADPDITEDLFTRGLRIKFTLAYSPSDDLIDDAVLPCVLLDAVSDRQDVTAFLYAGAAVVVTGRLRLPDQTSDRLQLEVTDLEEDGDCEDRRDTPGTVVALDQGVLDGPAPTSATTVDGCTVLLCERTDGSPVRYVLTPVGACAVVYTEDLVADTAAWLTRAKG
jgi:hypothetical protein